MIKRLPPHDRIPPDAQQCMQEILHENDRLRTLLAAVEGERQRLHERAQGVDQLLLELDFLRGQVEELRREAEACRRERDRLRDRLEPLGPK
jgi:chromosome segregation ATPase